MTALSTSALTTLADVKESLGISSGDHTKDNLIIRKINQASKVIENYCDTYFTAQNLVEIYDANPTSMELVLRNRPATVSKLEVRQSNTNDNYWSTIQTTMYFVDSEAGIIKFLDVFWGGWQQWRVTYVGGYSSIPDDIAEACATLASFYVENASSNSQVIHKKEGMREAHYKTAASDDPLDFLGLKTILDVYAQAYLTGLR